MAGEQLDEAFVGYSGIYGDRIYAFTKAEAPAFFPYFTGRDKQAMLLYKPRFRNPEQVTQPVSWAEGEAISIGLRPVFGSQQELAVEVQAPSGEVFAIDSPELASLLGESTDTSGLSLCHSERALTDARPISLISSQTLQQLSDEIGEAVDERRFRANIYVSFDTLQGFSEDDFIGRTLCLGDKVRISVVERDPRCEMITFDPDTGGSNPAILRQVVKAHNAEAGVYAAVLVEGVVKAGDSIALLD